MKKKSTNIYLQKLKDPRWQKKRLEILSEAGWKCFSCGSADKSLHIHHRAYKKGAEPWEYDDNELVCLCEDCHLYETEIDKRLDMLLYEFKTNGFIYGHEKTYLIGVLQAIMSDYSPYHDDVLIYSRDQCRGIADYMGYVAPKDYIDNGVDAADIIYDPADKNEYKNGECAYMASFQQMDWHFKPEEKSTFILDMAKSSPDVIKEVLLLNDPTSGWGVKFWPEKLKSEVLSILGQ